jgi:hypothetical protein
MSILLVFAFACSGTPKPEPAAPKARADQMQMRTPEQIAPGQGPALGTLAKVPVRQDPVAAEGRSVSGAKTAAPGRVMPEPSPAEP